MTSIPCSPSGSARRAGLFTPNAARFGTITTAALVFLAALICGLAAGRPDLSGDAWEYCWVTYSIAEHGSPVIDVQQKESLVRKFPAPNLLRESVLLPRGAGRFDPNHFWMYGLFAAPFYLLCVAIGCSFLYAFLLLHASFLAFTAGVLHIFFGKRGPLVFLAIFAGSPLLFWLNKAHTEVFVFCWLTLALSCIVKDRIALAVCCLAMVATQYTPYLPFVLLLIVIGLWKSGWSRSPRMLLVMGIGFFLGILNPAFYYLRHGTAIGMHGASLEKMAPTALNFRKAFSLFLDPDIGLFANWPLGVVLLIAAFLLHRYLRAAITENIPLVTFSAVFVVFMPLFVSFQANWNGGGTININRYATWFISFFVVWLLACTQDMRLSSIRSWTRTGLLVLAVLTLACVVYSVGKFSPALAQDYLGRNALSEALYRHFPNLYDPIEEVYFERSVGREGPLGWSGNWACSNAACNKIYAPEFPNDQPALPKPAGCEMPVDGTKLLVLLKSGRFNRNANGYVTLPEEELQNLIPNYNMGTRLDFSRPPASIYLGRGWSAQDPNGRWSDGESAEVAAKVASSGVASGHVLVLRIGGSPYSSTGEHCRVRVMQDGTLIGNLDAAHQLGQDSYELRLAQPIAGTLRLMFQFEGAHSPRQGTDRRRLGFYLRSLVLLSKYAGTNNVLLPAYREADLIEFSRPESESFLAGGWSHQESGGRWSDGPAAFVKFHLSAPTPAAQDFFFLIGGSPFVRGGRMVPVELHVNGMSAGLLDAARAEAIGLYRVKVAGLKPGQCEMKFVADRGNPAPAGEDPRRLGFYLTSLQVLSAQPFPNYELGTMIDFSSPSNSRFLTKGWSAQEIHGRWSDGKMAELRLRLNAPAQAAHGPGVLTIRGGKYQAAGRSTRVRLSLNGKILGSLDDQHLSGEDVYRFPLSRLDATNCTVSLLMDNPKASSADGEPRHLGFYIRSLMISAN